MVNNVVFSYCNFIRLKRNEVWHDLKILENGSNMLQNVDVLSIKKDEDCKMTLSIISKNKGIRKLLGPTYIAHLKKQW